MKIAIDISRANDKKKTGVSWYAFHLIQKFKEMNKKQAFELVLYSREPLRGELAKDIPKNWQVKILRWPPKRLWTQIRLSWEIIFHPVDILFVPAHVVPLVHPKKTIMTVHDIAAIKFPQSYSFFERFYSLWSAKFACKNLWQVIVPSQFTKNELISKFKLNKKESEKIKVIYHGYNNEYNKTLSPEKILATLEKYHIGKPFLLSIGRLEEKKNTIGIIKSFVKLKTSDPQKFSNLKLVLIGAKGYGYEKVLSTIKNSKFKNDIITPGWTKNSDLSAIMQGAEVFVFPSWYEGFGIPVLEAFASSTPAVVSDYGALREIGGEAAVYAKPSDINSIFQALKKMLSRENFYNEKQKMGRELVKNFSWEKCAKETWQIFFDEK